MNLYPIKFHPICKERIWGGTKLRDKLQKPCSGDNIGETWELSGVEGDVSIVANGVLAGKSLNELIAGNAEALLGKSVVERFGNSFPILIKFIDARLDLSIQLHPDDTLARERHNSFGKTEMWYIMEADKGAKLIVGFKRDVEKPEYLEAVKNNTLLDLLHYEEVAHGDTFFINSGKIHAIGAGVLLAEIQQTSDITYRVFDFNRKDKEGKYRELHTELAVDAIDYKAKDDFRIHYGREADLVNPMVDTPYFTTKSLHLTRNMEVDTHGRDSFTIYICTRGEATIATLEGSVSLNYGETVLIPAETDHITVSTDGVDLLEVTI